MTSFLLVVKQAGQNNLYRWFKTRASAMKHARADVARIQRETKMKLTDRKKYGLAVIYRAATTPIRFMHAVVEVYEMEIRS